ncbi:MAG: hypothetical protein DWQ18_00850 [Crenarchaeota archaeon]|nr:MAG: hypothetical protein DWQ17_04365 [Thermoproteota archaeon]RDJ34522.1 MAG: hypothetical protein DWQ18_00850 [Thermoproteota archaeon]RDJ34863.1 MAG: hypothetical protein DWQ19_13965 [Thermoproteota archaeon]RDJ38534.1 MAG: hypothetical protein DWQ13_03970 [Thermoproteota archaeon]
MLAGTYSLRNLIQNEEFLLELTRTLRKEITELEKEREDVEAEQKEARKQGLFVEKMTNYMSDELERLESSSNDGKSENQTISTNLNKLSETEKKLKILKTRLAEFVNTEDQNPLSDSSFSNILKQYEGFLLELTNSLNEKIVNLEKIINRLKAEKRESQQQKILLKEMVELFNEEIIDLEATLEQLRLQNA